MRIGKKEQPLAVAQGDHANGVAADVLCRPICPSEAKPIAGTMRGRQQLPVQRGRRLQIRFHSTVGFAGAPMRHRQMMISPAQSLVQKNVAARRRHREFKLQAIKRLEQETIHASIERRPNGTRIAARRCHHDMEKLIGAVT
ncbi:hypothetical protein [Sphingomonas mucosissima]|uniref:hypothetical protein n=1 Tax=Sphingomonas mucosissima TaxID=370959 RepID=UPI001FEC5187|nr:hypothetical protein [Sphingomonas mucosissima]